ncbi:MAG TPA: aminotransferase class I/II-fold pyridoxal phosphate-dependent enzyme [Actinomycetota bacterium]|nr:aminotransferase class I/II-fold pyridoxal phosphate-dependent enzyme [Actinomycetota bacterium]
MPELDLFRMERYQSLYWHDVEHDLSESGVSPMTIRELLGDDVASFPEVALGYPLSEGSPETRANIAAWYEGATTENVTVVNGGSEANFLTLWTLLGREDRLAFMVPNYMEGWGLGRAFGAGTDTFSLKQVDGRWALDLDELERAITPATKVVMVCNPDNPTGSVLSDAEMDAIVAAAESVGAWIVADEIYRGAEVDTDVVTPSFWGRSERVVITSGLSKAFAMPGLRIGWIVASTDTIRRIWERHDYTTLTPGMVSDRLAAHAMRPDVRERVLARTRSIVRANLPRLEDWIATHPAFSYVRPTAGAITYVTYDLPIGSAELVERIRTEQSVLLVPGEMFGLDPTGDGRGLRFGYGYDIEHTVKGLERADEVLRSIAP